ncbi:ACE1 transcriptional factor [Mycena kentingensis (nom. inval.)]|nr:ACE1 transcriptional factor [Mycena kentingensis (nom. inval.)]
MVLIGEQKYACETCIKGHRSSGCKHNDRPLFLIQKKGRPVTQCEHCRELRKTKQVHVKCICEAKEPPPYTALKPKKKGTPVIPSQAAFPNGISPELVSDSDQGGSAQSASGCACKAGTGECHCCTPRTRPVQRRSSAPSTSKPIPSPTQRASPNPDSSGLASNRAPSHHILARIAELRPVLPRMSARDAALQAQAGGQHDLFHGNHPPGSAHHHADHFSPYGRAYDLALHGNEGGSLGSFYQQDARSVESLMSVNSLSSQFSSRSHGKSSKAGKKSPIDDKGHGQRSASLDGQPGTFSSFFGAIRPPESDWRLLPSLSRASVDAAPYPRSEPSFPLADGASASDAVYARSEGGGGQFEDVGGHPRAQSEEYRIDLANMRMCGCGDSCSCPGCAVHNPASSNDNSPIPGQKRCTDAACGDACLDCTILGLSGYPTFDGPSHLKQEDELVSPLENAAAFVAADGSIPAQDGPQLRLEAFGDPNLPEQFEMEFDGFPTAPYGPVNIDEWIQALPPPPPSGALHSPFDFSDGDIGAFEFPDALPVGGAPPTWGAVQMFDADIEQREGAPAGSGGIAARSTTSTSSNSQRDSDRRFSGLSGGSPDPNLVYSHSRGSSGAFLTVPGPDAHRRSRSSSSASSDVSSGMFGSSGLGAGVDAMTLEHIPPPPSPLKQHHAPSDAGTMELSMLFMQHPAMMSLFPPPPSGIAIDALMDDDQMSFY